jgi:hypothetical protein
VAFAPGAEHRRRPFWGAAIAGGLAVVALAGGGVLLAAALVNRGEPPSAAPVRVNVIGDSLVHQAYAPLMGAFRRASYQAEVVGLPAQSLASTAVRNQIDAVARGGDDVLVLATASNDARALGPGQYRDELDDLARRFADRCLVVVNARDLAGPMYFPDRIAVINRELAAVDERHRNLVMVDWATRSRNLPPDAFSPDQLHFGDPIQDQHPNSPSARDYAAALVDGVRRCPARR